MFDLKKSAITAAVLGLSLMLTAAPAFAATDAAPASHTIKEGDTFWKLSQQYKVNFEQLVKANEKLDPQNLTIGSKVVISAPTEKKESKPSAKSDASASQKTVQAQSVTASNGTVHAFSDKLQVKATAYSAAASENGKWGAVDYFGNPLKVGTIAVDPNLIPLGTKVYVTGYSHDGLPSGGMIATASDMGGAIKGNRIDIFVPGSTTQASTFGIQDVSVYILK
ncbi:3D domain-containing protein [Paenibacillus sp. NPDC058174]|uniref:3D domain-containing protein n=1 Tax=Paenibacillus sp. NPDC058174 TaxID=3346366 RepID=UPI0036DE1F02